MFQESALRLLNVHCSLLLALSLSAAAGWGSFALARHTSTEMEHQLRDQAASLQTSQTQLAAERTKTQASLSEMAQLRAELAAARSEMNQLSQSREQVPVEFSPVRPNGKSTNIRSDDTNDDVSRTGAIGEKTGQVQKDKAVSAKLPRNQQIASVGIAQGTGKLDEKPQRGKAPSFSELDTAALRQMMKSTEAKVR